MNFLNGLAYDESIDGDKEYFWTSYSIRRDCEGRWIGQDGRDMRQNPELNDLNPDIRRVIFYRVSKDDDNQRSATPRLLGQAVFVFYDSSDFDRIKTIRPRYVGTLREDILGFLKEHYESDAFRAYLVKEEQMQAWQTLSGRSAHKIGNLLTAAEGALRRAGISDPGGDKAALLDLKSDLWGIRRIVDEYRKFAVNEPCIPMPTDVHALLERAVRQFRDSRDDTEIALMMPDGPLQWNIDPARMTEAIGELLDNALAVSDNVTVTAQAVPEELQIRVTDQGPGVAPDSKERIFEPFYSSRPGGSGLGLAIVRQIVENHGGTIKECGPPGQGACFVIELAKTKEKQT